MNDIVGKTMTHTKTRETGTITSLFPQVRCADDEIRNVPHVLWKSDSDGEIYASKLEAIVVHN